MLQKLKNQKGFTLVELIVVIAVLGVVGSFAVPALTGYADTAKENQAVSETQACVMTATTLAAKQRAASTVGTKSSKTSFEIWAGGLETAAPNLTGGDLALTEGSGQYYLNVSEYTGSKKENADAMESIEQTAEVTGKVGAVWFNSAGKVLYLLYTSKDGITVAYTNSGSTTAYNTEIPPAGIPTPTQTSGSSDSDNSDSDGGSSDGDTEKEQQTYDSKTLLVHMETGSGVPATGGKYTIVSSDNTTIGTDFTLDENGNLVCANGTPIKIAWTQSIAADGTVTLAASPYSYTIIETEAPEGYQALIQFKISVTINAEGDIIYGTPSETGWNFNGVSWNAATKTFNVPRYPINEIVIKFVDSNGTAVTGGKYKIVAENTTTPVLTEFTAGGGSYTIKVDNSRIWNKPATDGINTSSYLTSGNNYTLIQESSPPNGLNLYNYGSTTESVNFTIDGNSAWVVNVSGWNTCTKSQGNVLYVVYGDNSSNYTPESTTCQTTINVTESGSGGKLLAGATLTLKNIKDGTTETWSSTETSGKTFTLGQGIYLVTETDAPDGYQTCEPQVFTVETGDKAKTVTLENEKLNTVTFSVDAVYVEYAHASEKANPEYQKPLTDVKLSLYACDESGNATGNVLQTWTTDGTTKTIENLAPGLYCLYANELPQNISIDWTYAWDNTTSSNVYKNTINVDESNTSYTLVGLLSEGYKAVTISKVDSSGKHVADASLKLVEYSNQYTYWDILSWTTTNSAKTVFLQTSAYKYVLEETTPPNNYEKATNIAFTVSADGENSVTMCDATESGEISDSILTDDYKLSFTAQDWAHNLTTDGKIKLNNALYYWKGELYFAYKEMEQKDNENKQKIANGELALKDAPDPITFSDGKSSKSDYVVRLTGTIYNELNTEITFNTGDLFVFQNGSNANPKAYVYIGENGTKITIQSNNFKSEDGREGLGFWKEEVGKFEVSATN